MPAGIRLGPMSVALLILGLQALILAGLLLHSATARRAHRWLAALLVVMAGMLTPYVIGYAGFYDQWRWLWYAPFAVPLAIGPLLYGHVVAVVRDRGLSARHAVLPVVQFGYQAILFPQSLATKDWFDAQVEPWLTPLSTLLMLASLAGYSFAAWRLVAPLDASGQRRSAAIARLRRALGAVGLLVAAASLLAIWNVAVAPLSYGDRFGFYVLLALIAVWLGVEGWRDAAVPPPTRLEPAARDWAAIANGWVAELRAGEWWRDPTLDLAGLARRLGTNSSYLSRALNEGLATSFAELIGAIRAEDVARRIDAGDPAPLTQLALDAGFGSKASFNRAFGKRFGEAPSARRAALREKAAASMI